MPLPLEQPEFHVRALSGTCTPAATGSAAQRSAVYGPAEVQSAAYALSGPETGSGFVAAANPPISRGCSWSAVAAAPRILFEA